MMACGCYIVQGPLGEFYRMTQGRMSHSRSIPQPSGLFVVCPSASCPVNCAQISLHRKTSDLLDKGCGCELGCVQ